MDVRLLAFVGVATVITITPGADMALVARVALARGRNAAWLTSCGIVCGLLVWGIASAAGITVLLNASTTLYTVLRLAGAAYLIYLGAQALLTRAPAHTLTAKPRCQRRTRPVRSAAGCSTIYSIPRSACSIRPFCRSSSHPASRFS